jgi:hypothetical protein
MATHNTLPPVEIECPDCTTPLDVRSQPRPATDGGADAPVTAERRRLRGADLTCDCCGATVGVYVFP